MPQDSYHVSHRTLYDVWRKAKSTKSRSSEVMSFLWKNVIKEETTHSYEETIAKKIDLFCIYLKKKWDKCYRKQARFETENSSWLSKVMIIKKEIVSKHCMPPHLGRPCLPYDEMSHRTKRRVSSLLSTQQDHNIELLAQTTCYAVRIGGQPDLATVLNMTIESPTRPSKLKRTLLKEDKYPVPLTKEEALTFITDNNLTKQQYMNIRLLSKEKNADIYPPYNEILKAKSECYVEPLNVTDACAFVPLKNLIEKTLQRIVLLQNEVISQLFNVRHLSSAEAKLIISYGFDGTTGQSNYHQEFKTNRKDIIIDDSSLFATTMIPLRLVSSDGTVLWNNNSPQSIRFCRPLKLEFIKESKDHVLKEKALWSTNKPSCYLVWSL